MDHQEKMKINNIKQCVEFLLLHMLKIRKYDNAKKER